MESESPTQVTQVLKNAMFVPKMPPENGWKDVQTLKNPP
jgi:hypothetical protein